MAVFECWRFKGKLHYKSSHVISYTNFSSVQFVAPYEAVVIKAVCPGNAHCSRGQLFCIKEVFGAIMKHANSKKHKEL